MWASRCSGGRLDAAVLRVEEEVCGKSGPVGEITVRTRLACCQLWSGCIDVVRPQLSKRRHEGGVLELQLHGLRRAGGRARRNPRMLIFGCRFAPRCQLVPWQTTITKPQVLAQNGPFEDAERRQSVRFSHESPHAHPVALGVEGRGVGRERSAIQRSGRSVGAEADAKGSLLLAPATHSPHRERG